MAFQTPLLIQMFIGITDNSPQRQLAILAFVFGGRLSSAVGNDDVHRSAM